MEYLIEQYRTLSCVFRSILPYPVILSEQSESKNPLHFKLLNSA